MSTAMRGSQHCESGTLSHNALAGLHCTISVTIDTAVMTMKRARLVCRNHFCQEMLFPRIRSIINPTLDFPTAEAITPKTRAKVEYFKTRVNSGGLR